MSEEFNKTVTYRDEATGMITHTDPYVLRVGKADDGGKTRTWERPPGSGNLFDSKGNPIGRRVNGKHVVDAEHVAFKAPETSDTKLARETLEKDARISELEKQLAGIKAEKEKKTKA